jgi:RNA polymerase sigma-70 factor (sigma-E family)
VGVERFGHHGIAGDIILERMAGPPTEGWDVTVSTVASVGAAARRTKDTGAEEVAGHDAIAALFEAHYGRLVHLARHLLDEPASAEDVVMDAFASLTRRWRDVRDRDAALGYLRSSVVFGSRTKLRRRIVARRHQADEALPTTAAAADQLVLDRLELAEVAAAVHELPTRQRQAVVLRYYEELSVAQVADLLGCSTGSVKTHTSRGLARLASTLGGTR